MKKGKTHTMKSLLSIMLRIGTFGFGGGTALIPVIEEEVTKNNKLINDDESKLHQVSAEKYAVYAECFSPHL